MAKTKEKVMTLQEKRWKKEQCRRRIHKGIRRSGPRDPKHLRIEGAKKEVIPWQNDIETMSAIQPRPEFKSPKKPTLLKRSISHVGKMFQRKTG